MEYHDPIDPPVVEACDGGRADAVVARQYILAPDFMLENPSTSQFRLRPELRVIAQRAGDPKADVAYPLSMAVQTLFWQANPSKAPDPIGSLLALPGHAFDFANAMADLAVTGWIAFKKFAATKPQDAYLLSAVTPEIQVRDPTADLSTVSNFVRLVLDRAYNVAWALRAHQNRQLYLDPVNNPLLGWIAVSAEDDQPHRPVNVPTAPFPAFDIDVMVDGRILRARFAIISSSTEITTPIIGPFEGIRDLPPEPPPIIPVGEEVILYVHGHGSRLEECLDLARKLWKPTGSKSCKSYTVIAMDLPGCGYSEMLNWQEIVVTEESDQLLRFHEDFLLALTEGLTKYVRSIDALGQPIDLRERIATVIGGSLGGNLTLRLGLRTQPYYISTVVPWSPASVWDPFVNDLFKDTAPKTALGRCQQDESKDSRIEYFQRVFDEKPGDNELNAATAIVAALGALSPPIAVVLEIVIQMFRSTTNPNMWYRDDWQPCKGDSITGARRDREEIYNPNFRKWDWRLVYEMLRFSFKTPSDDPQYRHVRSRTLLCAGEKDNYKWANIFDATREMASMMWNTSGSTLFLKETGHSIHDERPGALAGAIHEFLPPLPDSWSAWDNSLGGSLTSKPCIAMNEDERLEVFALGQDSRVWHTWQTSKGSWAGATWAELGPGLQQGATFSFPPTSNRPSGRNRQRQIEIFDVDGGGRICHDWQKAMNDGWQDWNLDLSGNPNDGPEHRATSQVAVVRKIQNGLQVVLWRDGAGNIRLRGQTTILDGWWDSWADKLPLKTFAGPPVAESNESGAIEVIATTSGGEVFTCREIGVDKDQYGQTWISRGGAVVPGSLAVIRNERDGGGLPAGCLILFACGTGNDLQFTNQLNPDGNQWSVWQSLGGQLMPGSVPAVERGDRFGGLFVFARFADGTMQYRRQSPERPGQLWSDWTPLDATKTFVSDPVVVRKLSGSDPGLEVFAIGQDSALWRIWQKDC